MKPKSSLKYILAGLTAITVLFSFWGCTASNAPPSTAATEETIPTEPTEESIPETLPQEMIFTLSFAGDCTLGTSHDTYGRSGSFVKIVGNDYGYPFKNVVSLFEDDDFTMVNLEGTFTEYTVPAEKRFRFRAPSSYAKILTAGNVEAVNLANNHSYDFGEIGYADTKKALDSEGITYVEQAGTTTFTTSSGLKIGMFAAYNDLNVSVMQSAVSKLRSEGAELIIVSYNWGTEGSYRPTELQKSTAHAAIDAGADIVFGHHPHVLQPIETYKDGIIYYSLGNFSFGGNTNPRDKDTAIIRQSVIRKPDGSICLGETQIVPCSVSSVSSRNDYQPTPYKETNSKYQRVLSKLDGSFTGKDLVVNYGNSSKPSTPTTPTTSPTTEPDPSTSETTEATTVPTTVPTEPTNAPTVPDSTDDEYIIPI